MAKLKKNPNYKNYRVSVCSDGVIETYQVLDIVINDIEYEHGFLSIDNATTYVDQTTGGLHYFFDLDLPSKVEAKNLKMLRRSMAIKNIFSYDVDKTFDLFKFLPWLVIILLVLFK